MTDCYLCGRNVELDLTVRVDFELFITDVCDECYARGEEAADVADPITEAA